MERLQIIQQPQRLIARITQERILAEEDVQSLAQELMEAAKQPKSCKTFVLDFQHVQSMSSAMVGKLVLLNTYFLQNDIRFYIWNVAPNVMQVFRITRLNRFLRISDEEEEDSAFRFAPELFEVRNRVLAALEDADFCWMRDYTTVDPLHDVYGIEVRGIPNLDEAQAIQRLLCQLFPDWQPG